MNPKIEKLLELVADNQLEKVLEQLTSIFSLSDSELFLDANSVLSDFKRLKSDIRRKKGVVEEREITKNQIRSNVLSLIDELKNDTSILENYNKKASNFNTASLERSNLLIYPFEYDALFRRMANIKERSIEFRALWIDDEPHFQVHERGQLEEIGVDVDIAANEDEANGLMRNFNYDLIISDIARPGREKNGLDFLKEQVAKENQIPFIFYISKLDKSFGTPPYAFGITNSVAELFHLVMDVIERK